MAHTCFIIGKRSVEDAERRERLSSAAGKSPK
jgi:hypothetical protein